MSYEKQRISTTSFVKFLSSWDIKLYYTAFVVCSWVILIFEDLTGLGQYIFVSLPMYIMIQTLFCLIHIYISYLNCWIWAKSSKRKLSVSEAPLQHLNCHQSVCSEFVSYKMFFLCVCKNFMVFEIPITNSKISTVINLFALYFVFCEIFISLYLADSSYSCICRICFYFYFVKISLENICWNFLIFRKCKPNIL